MNWLSYIYPQTIALLSSKYNKHIRVNLEKGRYKLLVNGTRESGAFVEGLWTFAFSRLALPRVSLVRSMLVIGVAGGSVIHRLRGKYPDASITGVDIDQVMIDVGKKYFGLNSLSRAEFVCDDAAHYVRVAPIKLYDLIVLDVFIGPDIPDFIVRSVFQMSLKKRLRRGGTLFINYIHQEEYGKKADALGKILREIYSLVRTADIYNNRFFLAR